MESTHSLASLLQEHYPEFHFQPGETFRWSPDSQTIFYEGNDLSALLHELAHAILGHQHYLKDMELIEMERDAWEHAKSKLSPRYSITIEDEIIEAALDSYRDWLHARSSCTTCGSTGIQTTANIYRCIACKTSWRVNEARICALRRYTLTN